MPRIQITGQSYEHPSREANYQRSVNLFMSPTGDENVRETQLHSPGLSELVDLTGNQVRAIIPIEDTKFYVVVDQSLYVCTLSTDKTTVSSTLITTLTAGFLGRISWQRNPTQVMLVDGSTIGYVITIASDTAALITDTDFTGAVTVDFLGSYFIYNTPNASTMFSTGSNEGTTVDALDVATAESSPDLLKAITAHRGEIWALGTKTTEIWYNAGNPVGFPFSRRDGAVLDRGLSSAYSVVKIDNTLMWLDDRRFVVQTEGYGLKEVSTTAISNTFKKYDSVSDAHAFAYEDRGQKFYQITFPTPETTWVYDITTKKWHEKDYLDPVTDKKTRHLANCHAVFQNLNLVGAYNSGKIYILTDTVYTDAGNPIIRNRTTAHFTQELKQVTIAGLELHAELGKGPQGSTDPTIMLRYSNDGGHTWSDPLDRSLGQLGEYATRVRWNRLGTGSQWIFEFTTASPVPISLLELYADIERGTH